MNARNSSIFTKTILLASIICLGITPIVAAVTLTQHDDFEDAAVTESTWIQGLLDSQDDNWIATSGVFRGHSSAVAAIGKDGPCAIRSGPIAGFTNYRNTEMSISFDMRYIEDPNLISAGVFCWPRGAKKTPTGRSCFLT